MLPLIVIATLGVWTTDLDSDEEVVFFPSYAYRTDDGAWRANVRGWLLEIDSTSSLAATLSSGLGIASAAIESVGSGALLVDRARPFLSDIEPGQRVSIRAGDRTYVSRPSEASGHFLLPVQFDFPELHELRRAGEFQDGWLRYTANVKVGDPRAPTGEIAFISSSGRSVISDIDDTIKSSDVRDKKSLLINTFLKPFAPVPGMSELYQSWAKHGDVPFHYVSASPCQLFRPLQEFMQAERFPRGTIFLKPFHVRGRSPLDLLGPQDDFKLNTIQPILSDFPHRRFILVGDSGEQDPEIYAELARRNPRQIEHIYIRNTTDEPSTAPRYAETFRDLHQTQWTVFDDPTTLLPEPGAPESESK